MPPPPGSSHFDTLTPDRVLDLVERAQDRRCSNLCRPLNSYINRVYEVHMEEGDPLIAKFYRPRRWSEAALMDEHTFLQEMREADIPVVAPITNADGLSLFKHQGMQYALFPRFGGRICDEPDEQQWRELGRITARMHLVGDLHAPVDRVIMDPDDAAQDHLTHILESGFVAEEHLEAYAGVAESTLDLLSPLFENCEFTRIHGDLHVQNLIYRPDDGFHIIDLDDMAWGPPVQDLWMLLPGRAADARREVRLFLEGYRALRDFEEASLRLIEPLRAMRFLHYTSWCVHQAEDGGFTRLDAGWGSPSYWKQETTELLKQQQEIRDSLAGIP